MTTQQTKYLEKSHKRDFNIETWKPKTDNEGVKIDRIFTRIEYFQYVINQ